MEDWRVGLFLDDGTCVCELTVTADGSTDASAEAIRAARQNGLCTRTIRYTSSEPVDESRRIFTGGSWDTSSTYGCIIP